MCAVPEVTNLRSRGAPIRERISGLSLSYLKQREKKQLLASRIIAVEYFLFLASHSRGRRGKSPGLCSFKFQPPPPAKVSAYFIESPCTGRHKPISRIANRCVCLFLFSINKYSGGEEGARGASLHSLQCFPNKYDFVLNCL